MSASFQDKGRPSRKEVFMISMMGRTKGPSSPLRAIRGYCPILVPWLS